MINTKIKLIPYVIEPETKKYEEILTGYFRGKIGSYDGVFLKNGNFIIQIYDTTHDTGLVIWSNIKDDFPNLTINYYRPITELTISYK